MQITITGDQSSSDNRKVARDVDIDNFTVLDQVFIIITGWILFICMFLTYYHIINTKVGEEDVEKSSSQEEENTKKSKDPEPVDLEKVVIKRRERKDDRKSSDGKDLIVKKPSSLISILAKRKSQMSISNPTSNSDTMTDQERSEIRKKCKAKVLLSIKNIICSYNFDFQFANEDKVTEKVISMALDLSNFIEDQTCSLIESILKEDSSESNEVFIIEVILLVILTRCFVN